MRSWERNRQECLEFAKHIASLGFEVYLANGKFSRGEYGFITDESHTRVMCFSFTGLGAGTLHGNYNPGHSLTCGSGWQLEVDPHEPKTAEDVRKALYATPPSYCEGWKDYTTVEQYLKKYQDSSKFTSLEEFIKCE